MKTSSEFTYDLSLLQKSAKAWEESKALRMIYRSLYREIQGACVSGPTLEVGSGIGKSREVLSNVVTSDIVETEYVDRAMSAYRIELTNEGSCWSNIVALDVLHHLTRPFEFLESASLALREGGRIVLLEPAATLGGTVFYKLFHHEPIAANQLTPPFNIQVDCAEGGFANMGMAMALFKNNPEYCCGRLDDMSLKLIRLDFRDLAAYPLSGGYSKLQLLPSRMIEMFLNVESFLPQWFLKIFGLRMMIVIEKV